MSDFYQNGIITNFHNLTRRPLQDLEAELSAFAVHNPMSLVLPSLFTELEGPALDHIVNELAQVPYLSEIIIGLDRADEKQYRFARRFFERLPQYHRILWNDGPRLTALDAELTEKGLAPTEAGKGRNVWYCFGFHLASRRGRVVALHDCDIATYSREMLARLLYPVADPRFPYIFCKGYYPRVTDTGLNGRVTRLLVTPLLRTLRKMYGQVHFLDYLDSYRYPLAGEFSMRSSILNEIRIPNDWGLEIGILSEVHRNFATNRLCQVDIADRYDHKHQGLSLEDPQQGLSKMSIDIAKAIFRKLATQGQVFNFGEFRTIKATYYRTALDFIEIYYNDAVMNGLEVDRHKEEAAVELFARNIMVAGAQFLDNPMEMPFIPNWQRVTSAIPDFLGRLHAAVEADGQMA
jgi:glucosyl-3-phosphoglycerate synthase